MPFEGILPWPTAGIDLRGLPYCLFDDKDFLESEADLCSSAEEWRAIVRLRLVAMRQTPGGSLPDNDRMLARWALLDLRAFRRIKAAALAGWELIQGRWFHATAITPPALAAGKGVAKRSKAGRRGNQGRWGDRRQTEMSGFRPPSRSAQATENPQNRDRNGNKVDGSPYRDPSTDQEQPGLSEAGAAHAPLRGARTASDAAEPTQHHAEQQQGGEEPLPPESTTDSPAFGAAPTCGPAAGAAPIGDPVVAQVEAAAARLREQWDCEAAAMPPSLAQRQQLERAHAEGWVRDVLGLDVAKRDAILAAARAWPAETAVGYRKFTHAIVTAEAAP